MKVSIIVPTYNREHLLKETIDSILNQTFKDFELIIVDNYSSDDTEEVVKSCNNHRIRYFKNQNNGIIAINRNFGIEKSKGEFIGLCDDDDIWMPDKLEKQLSEFEKDETIGLVCTNGMNFNENGDFGLVHKNSLNDDDFKFESIVIKNPIISSSILIKKSVINDVGMMDEEPEFFGAEDNCLWIKIAKKYKVKYIDLPLIKYRTHSGVYRKVDINGLNIKEKIYEKFLKNGIIDIELFNKVKSKLKYDELVIKLTNNEKVKFTTIIKTKTDLNKKFRLILLYFLLNLRIFKKI